MFVFFDFCFLNGCMCKLGFLGVIGFLRDVVIVVVDFGNGSDLEV